MAVKDQGLRRGGGGEDMEVGKVVRTYKCCPIVLRDYCVGSGKT
jgi:hypothetical protein